jgi:DNA-binding CsgD family transcriptional regulator
MPWIRRNGMSIDEFVEEVRSHAWRFDNDIEGIAVSTIIYNHTKWCLGKIKQSFKKPEFSGVNTSKFKEMEDIVIRDELNYYINIKALNDNEKTVLKYRSKGYRYSEIAGMMNMTRQGIQHIERTGIRKIQQHEKVLD